VGIFLVIVCLFVVVFLAMHVGMALVVMAVAIVRMGSHDDG
jgi:hypothetical protein